MTAEANHFPLSPKGDMPIRLSQLQVRMAARIRMGVFGRSTRYGLRRDIRVPLEKPKAKIPISIRPMVRSDLALLLAAGPARDNPQEMLEIAWRRGFVEKGAKTCFVAVDERDNRPCYMQWLISSADNDFVRRLRSFPELQPDEALLENAYTPIPYRGLGIMSAAMALIAERAADVGANYVLTFVDEHNIPSLKGCQRAGFSPHLLHHKIQLGFGVIRRHRFEVLGPADPIRALKF